MTTPTHIGIDRCTRCGGGSRPCPVCNPAPEIPTPRKAALTDEQIRIALARARGLFRIEPLRRTDYHGKVAPKGTHLWYCDEHHCGEATYTKIPDWPNDLNAVHRLEAWLYENGMTSEQWGQYGKLLEDSHPEASVLSDGEVDYHELAHICHISARRRCLCLIDALGL